MRVVSPTFVEEMNRVCQTTNLYTVADGLGWAKDFAGAADNDGRGES